VRVCTGIDRSFCGIPSGAFIIADVAQLG
jgi:hypothetical protein